MRIRPVLIAVCLLSLLVAQRAGAFEVTSVNLHLYLSGLKEAHAPIVVEDYLVLSAAGPYRFVGAAFADEDWKSVHPFQINRYGVFVLAMPLPYGDASVARYRLILDGIWAADPANPVVERDRASGAAISVAQLPERPTTVLGVWEPAQDGFAQFHFEGAPGQRVSVAGSFNSWDPFIHELEEIAPGHYELQLSLPPGEYYYVFVYRGQRVADPLNKRLVYSKDGRQVSALTIPGGG